MKCTYCGFETEDNSIYCVRCGRQLQAETLSLNPMADRVSNLFTDGLFLVICILMSANAAFTLFCGSIPVFQVLFAIFLWLCFAQGRSGFVDQTHIRSLSGTVFAYYIVQFVGAGLLSLLGLFFSAVFSLITNSSFFYEDLAAEMEFESLAEAELFEGLMGMMGGFFLIIILIMAAGIILINIFGIRKIHKFIQSLYQSVEINENRIVFAKAARTWLIVLGSINLAASFISIVAVVPLATLVEEASSNTVTVFSGAQAIFSVVAGASYSLCVIFAGVLINKHFINND